MDEIRAAGEGDVRLIGDLASRIWKVAYADILPEAQIELMLGDMYSPSSLQRQLHSGHRFALFLRNTQPVAFVSFELRKDQGMTRIEKLYVMPEQQGKGVGSALLRHVEDISRAEGLEKLQLNVNRRNPARAFYLRGGFSIVDEVDIPYGVYVLDDYIMEKIIKA